MPNVYRNSKKIDELRGRVRGGVSVVVHSPGEASGLQHLLKLAAQLPGDPLANVYDALRRGGPELAAWPGWTSRTTAYEGAHDDQTPPAEAELDGSPMALYLALELARQLWEAQGEDAQELALLFALPSPKRKAVVIETGRPALLLDHGSIRARISTAGSRLRDFAVALFPIARSRRQANLVEALWGRAPGRRLPRLERLGPADLRGKTGAIVFLHGLMSTDTGTFDGLIGQIEKAEMGERLLLVGWPHDTLTEIDVNGQELAELIQRKLAGLPIAFVCHSRGGLVARSTAVHLIGADESWKARVRGMVTFGTPHKGAELAEMGDEALGKLMLLKVISQGGAVVPLIDALWTIRDRKKIPGITDLRPRRNGGTFLKQLCKAEWKLAGQVDGQPVPLFAVGGAALPQGLTAWLSRRFFGGESNDLVVALSSSTPSSANALAHTDADHFSYFVPIETQKAHFKEVLSFLSSVVRPTPTVRERSNRPRRKGVSATSRIRGLAKGKPQPQSIAA